MNDSIDIGKNVANYRKIKRLTQAELAKSIGISKGYLGAIEGGRKVPQIKTLARIAKYLDIELGELLRERH